MVLPQLPLTTATTLTVELVKRALADVVEVSYFMTQLGVQPTAPHHPQLTITGFRMVSRELYMDPNLETPYFEGHKQGKQIICLRFLCSAPIQHGGLKRAWNPCAEMYN